MQHLLMRYGDTVFLDATYKTSRWAEPPFVLAVRTNSGYQPVAILRCKDETSASIYEALQVVREDNPDCKPSYRMSDCDESEMKALRKHFTGLSCASRMFKSSMSNWRS